MPLIPVAAFTLGCGWVLLWPERLPIALALPLLLAALWRPLRGPLLALLLGAGLSEWRVSERLADRWPAERHGEDVTLRGWVTSLPERHSLTVTPERVNWRFRFEPDAEGRAAGAPARIRVSWYRTPETVQAGECWELRLRLRMPRGSHNPGGFDYEGWLFRERLGATAAVREARRCEAEATGLRARVLRLRSDWMERVSAVLGDHPGAALVAALSVGDGRGLTPAHWQVFRTTGTSHLVIISGLHLAFMTGLGYGLVRLLWPLWPAAALALPTPWAAGLGAGLFATAYAVLAGLQTPVLRALLMVWLGLWLAWRGGWRQPYRALALIWGLIVALDPVVLLRPGLWLSFGAVAGIIHLTAFRVGRPAWWRVLLTVQVGLGLLLAPLTLGFFEGATLLAPLANLIAVPVFTLLTPLALLAVLLTVGAPALGIPLLKLAASLLGGAYRALEALAAQAGGLWIPAAPPLAAVGLAGLGMVLLTAPRGLPLRPLGLLCLLPLFFAPERSPREGVRLTVLDVGQGLAAVVQTPGHVLLYDTGPAFEGGFDAGESVVVPWLRRQGIRRIDRLVISHWHQDHEGGLDAVRGALPVGQTLGARDGPPCEAGQAWEWDGVRFSFLHPPAGAPRDPRGGNDDSCVLHITGPKGRILLPGDAERRTEFALLAREGKALAAEVLVSGHHGSRTSSTPAFVAAVAPQLVIHSAGWRHHFGHPHPQVVARFAAQGAAQRSTAESGALTVEWDAEGRLRVSGYRETHRRRWHAPAAP